MLSIAAIPKHPPFLWLTLLALLLILGVSLTMFALLIRRWTSRRQWVSLAEWTRETGFRIRPSRRDVIPEAARALVSSDSQVRFHLCDPRTTLIQFQTDPVAPDALPPMWNLLIRDRPESGAVAGLRPVSQPISLLDLMELSKFPQMTGNDRFTVHANDYTTARRLVDTSARALLPPDVGLILLKDQMLLDFSSRPFDPIEFDRMLSLADQLAEFI